MSAFDNINKNDEQKSFNNNFTNKFKGKSRDNSVKVKFNKTTNF